MNQSSICVLLASLLICAGCATDAVSPPPADASQYKIEKIYQIGGDGRWDYLKFDAESNRLFVTRQTHVQVIDPDSGKVIGDIPGLKSVHGVAIMPDVHQGYISDGGADEVVVFDLASLAVQVKLPAGKKPDAIIYDPFSHCVMAFCGKGESVSVYPTGPANRVATSIDLGGGPEFAVSDGQGHVYVNLEDESQVVQIDTQTMTISNRWPITGGESPSGISMDAKNRRLFIGCHNKVMAVMDADSGKVLATPPIGSGVDACGFDPQTGLAFASCGDGTLAIIKETSPGKYETVASVPTLAGARTMALNPKTHEVYLATADMEPATEPGKKPKPVPGTFKIVVVGP